MKTTFFYPYPDEIQRIDSIDYDDFSFWGENKCTRRRAWIVRTYRLLREKGCHVALSASLPSEGVVVLLPEDHILDCFRSSIRSKKNNLKKLFVVTVRADILEYRYPLADLDITQNGRFADGRRTLFVPHWPQFGLVPRNSDRGSRIENIVFKGRAGSLSEEFWSPEWKKELKDRGLFFHISGSCTDRAFQNWHDYSAADLSLAVRPCFEDGGLRCEKPASKLINAWHAGVPSLVGREYAFLELRESPLDYIEVQSPADALAAIDRLLADPSLYLSMIEQGRKRAAEFSEQKIVDRWAEVLFEHVPNLIDTPSHQWSRSLPLPLRQVANVALAPPSLFELRKQVGSAVRRARVAGGRALQSLS